MDVDKVVHFASGEALAEVSRANACHLCGNLGEEKA
jgi:hypothetical protein